MVGNGATVLGSRAGRDIDAHDAVFRVNFPRTAGFEADVGRRTTHMFANSRWGGNHLGRPPYRSIGDYWQEPVRARSSTRCA